MQRCYFSPTEGGRSSEEGKRKGRDATRWRGDEDESGKSRREESEGDIAGNTGERTMMQKFSTLGPLGPSSPLTKLHLLFILSSSSLLRLLLFYTLQCWNYLT